MDIDFSNKRVLVAGDFILDEYLWGKADRISPEAPVMIVDVKKENFALGGAGNVVNNLVSLGAQVKALGLVGDDYHGYILVDMLSQIGVKGGFSVDPKRHTSRKTRVLAGQQQVVRIDRESREPADQDFVMRSFEFINEKMASFDAVVLSDYAKGVLTKELIEHIISLSKSYGIPVIVDPKGADFSPYAGATVLTPNRREAERAIKHSLEEWEDLITYGELLKIDLKIDNLLITLGQNGMILFDGHRENIHFPTRAVEIFDVSGAGDTVAAVMALIMGKYHNPRLAAEISNIAAGIVVGKVGTAPITLKELQEKLNSLGL